MDGEKFVAAVKATAKRHPQLRSIIDERGFLEIPGFEASDNHYEVLDVESSEESKAIAEMEGNLSAEMYGPKPLWKIILLRVASEESNVLLVKFHHCIGDGSSGYIITHDVLRFYQSLTENGQLDDIVSLPRLESADKMSFPEGTTADDARVADELYSQFVKRRCEWAPSSGLPFDRKVGGEHNTTLYRDGCQENSDALLAKCRSKGLTVGAVLVAGTYFAIAKMDAQYRARLAADPDAEFSFDFDMDVNLRKRLQTVLGNDHVGTIIGMMSFSLRLKASTKFWEFVLQVKEAMTDFLESKLHFHYFGVNERFDAACESMPKFQENLSRNDGLVQDMNFSSFGRYFYDTKYGQLQIEKMYASGGGWCPTFGSCVFLILGLKQNHYTFVYSKSDGNSRVAEDFFGKAVDIIEASHSFDDVYSLGDWLSC